MTKEYIKPQITVLQMQAQEILAGSQQIVFSDQEIGTDEMEAKENIHCHDVWGEDE